MAVGVEPAAMAPIGPLTWKHPYAIGAALKRKKENKRQTPDAEHYIRCHSVCGISRKGKIQRQKACPVVWDEEWKEDQVQMDSGDLGGEGQVLKQ